MSCIVCATRGGEGSRAVQLAAIDLARRENKRLVFLFVTDSHVLEGVDESLKSAVRDEFQWMGKVMLHIAKHRAGASEIEVELVVRQGDVQEEIGRFLRDSNAEMLLLGAPRGTTATIFGDDAIEQFAQSIQDATGVNVKVIRPELPDQLSTTPLLGSES